MLAIPRRARLIILACSVSLRLGNSLLALVPPRNEQGMGFRSTNRRRGTDTLVMVEVDENY